MNENNKVEPLRAEVTELKVQLSHDNRMRRSLAASSRRDRLAGECSRARLKKEGDNH
jgi:hypothetical protein